MPIALIRKSTLAVDKEVTYGVIPAMTSAHVISVWGVPNFNSTYDQVEDNTVRNTLDKLGTVRGAETASGDLSVPFKGSGTAGTVPDSDVLYECAMGGKNVTTATTTHGTTACTTTSIALVTGGVAAAGLAVGDAVLIGGEVTWVTAIATDTLTVSPALTSAPGFGAAVGAGVHYKLGSDRLSFAAKFWRGDITREDYSGLVVESLDVDFATGQIPIPKFAFQGKTLAAATPESAAVLGTPSLDQTSPLIAKNMVVDIGGVSYGVSNIALSVKYDIYRRLSVATSGTQDILHTARSVSGSFSVLYEDQTIQDAFLAATENEARIVCGSTAGNIFAMRVPKMRFSEVPKSEESGLYKYDVSFECLPTAGNDALTSVSWL